MNCCLKIDTIKPIISGIVTGLLSSLKSGFEDDAGYGGKE